MDVEKSSRAAVAFLQSCNAMFWTIFVFSLIASVAIPEARLLSGSLLAACFVKTAVGVINSENRRDEFWRIARQMGFVFKVVAAIVLALAGSVALLQLGLAR